MSELTFLLPQNAFEGPLDLLLHLISKHKLDLYDINIIELVDQYMAYMNDAQRIDMDLTGDFLEMASRLVYMKTVMLLPRREEEKEQLKTELQGQLIEYQLCRRIAAHLRDRGGESDLFVRAPQPAPPGVLPYTRRHDTEQLLLALAALKGKLLVRQAPPKKSFSGIVAKRVVSVSSRILFVLRRLKVGAKLRYEALFSKKYEKTENVATFLALLELIKGGRIRLDDEGEITLKKTGRRAERG
ncbi:ScpA family protein [Neobittarella massiliensis]|uniref:segregation and condensation protein A n=1 Tax=Neobittarella massiliensis (ex Bilen et al. 2018) TaxID=2041842 RepID=UPI000CF68288|nr:ScpA family protein [Neobittarella massiliensis]